MSDCTPYAALTRYLRSLEPDVTTCAYTLGELHAAICHRLPMGAESASAWQGACNLGRAVAAAGFTADLRSTDRGWVVTFTRRQRDGSGEAVSVYPAPQPRLRTA